MVSERSPGSPTLRVSGAGLWANLRMAVAARILPFWPPVLGSYFCAVQPHQACSSCPSSPSAPSALQTTINTPHYKEWRCAIFFTRAFHVLASLGRGAKTEVQNRWREPFPRQEMSRMQKNQTCVLNICKGSPQRRVDMCIYKCADRSLNIQTHFMIVLCLSSG